MDKTIQKEKEKGQVMTNETEKEYSREFQNNLLDLFEMCYENHTDNCTLTFEYPNAVMEVDFTFRAKKRVEDGNDD